MGKRSLKDIGEFELISRIRRWFKISNPSLIRGIGDDSAVIELGKKVLLITTDILIEDIHFNPAWIDPFNLGKKSLYVNLSDIAAMGGKPRHFLISLGVPKSISISYISSFYRGLKYGAKMFNVDLIGGDTSLSKNITINICLLGEADKGDVIFRKGARPEDDIYVSGTLGDSALGLEILKREGLNGKANALIKRHLSPIPRVELGMEIGKKHLATSMIDISDGLLIDLQHILEESNVGAQIWEERIPVSGFYRRCINNYSNDFYRFAKTGGEDYELLFTVPPRLRSKVLELSHSINTPITRIGKILPRKDGLYLIKKDGTKIYPKELGFEHFKIKI